MLHVANGDSIAGSLKQSTLPGEKMAFREALTCGPAPSGLSSSEWLRLRANFLGNPYGPSEQDCLQGLTEQQAVLETRDSRQETVLWFAHDLDCQVHLINVLNLLGRIRSDRKDVSLICIGEFPGVIPFVCLGQLEPENLESLFEIRHQVTPDEFDLAAKAWSAYCSSDPTAVKSLTTIDTNALPFLGEALRLHLARFPSLWNGLGLIENWALEQLSAGQQKFGPLFARFIEQHPRYGLGDTHFWDVLKRISDCSHPLIQISGAPAAGTLESIAWGPVSLEITSVGLEVLQGKKDFIELNGIDLWLGGVHLTGQNHWRIDTETDALTHSAA